MTRVSPTFRHVGRIVAWPLIGFLSLTVTLAGCVAPPRAPHDSSVPATEQPVAPVAEPDDATRGETVQREPDPHLPIESRRPFPINPDAFATPGRDSTQDILGPSDADAKADGDTWVRIREGLFLPSTTNSRVKREVEWYSRNQEYFHRTVQRAQQYLAYIVRQVEQRQLPMKFALLPFVESAFRPFAYSSAGASGLWQFIPSTGRLYGLKQNRWYDGRRDIVASTRAALDYLSKLLKDFDDDNLLAVAAYNWGEGNVMRAISRNRSRGKPADVWSLRLPRETRAHVSRLLAISAIVADPGQYGVVLEPIPYRDQFQQIPIDGQMDLSHAAELAGITLDEIHLLNPGFNRRVTSPTGPHRLLLPNHAVERFESGLSASPDRNFVKRTFHVIVPGDTLGGIAIRYATSVAALKRINGLSSDRIRAGRHLMVPVSVRATNAARVGDGMKSPLDRKTPQGSVESIHTVQYGDTLWRISGLHGVSVTRLATWNNLSMESVIRPGQRLKVYGHDAVNGRTVPGAVNGRTVSDAATATPAELSAPAAIHVVEHGDTLSEIAERHGTTVRSLTDFNRIAERAILRPGQKLQLTPTSASKTPSATPGPDGHGKIRYRVKTGDSLWEISRQFGVSVASLREWNQLPKGELLIPGRELDVHLKRSPAI